MLWFRCSSCGRDVPAADSLVGQSVPCPQCGALVAVLHSPSGARSVLAAMAKGFAAFRESEREQAAEREQGAETAPREHRRPYVPLAYLLGGFLIFIGGCIAVVDVEHPRYYKRFNDDYATGATANAVERIAQTQWLVRPGEIVVCGALLLVFGRLGVLIHEIRERPL